MNANPQRGEVDIVLDKPRIIRLTTNALAKAEDILGRSLINGNPFAVGFREIRTLVYVGLNDPQLTIDQVGDLIDEADKAKVTSAVFKAWNLHLGRGMESEKAKEGDQVATDPLKAAAPAPGKAV